MWAWAVALLAIAIAGVLRLPTPPHGDHALFMVGARTLADGGRLYVDFWDNKQPGIYWYSLLSGSLFGYRIIATRVMELAGNLVFTGVLVASGRRLGFGPLLSALLPLAIMGSYYASGEDWFLGQVEAVTLPWLFVAAWACTRALDHPDSLRWHFVIGFASGVTALFKFVLTPLPFVFWLTTMLANHFLGESPPRRPWALVIAAGAGAALPLGAAAAWFWFRGSLDEATWTTFVYPLGALADLPMAGWGRLKESLLWVLGAMGPWLLLMAIFALGYRGVNSEWLFILCWLWIVVGGFLVMVQKFSWWSYHFQLFYVPVGLLAIRGVFGLIETGRGHRWRSALAGLLVVVGVGLSGVRILQTARITVGALRHPKPGPHGVARAMSGKIDGFWTASAVLREDGREDATIYVFGDPIIMLLNDKTYAIPPHGWAWEFFGPELWAALPAQLAAARPDFIVLDDFYRRLMVERAPGLLSWIETEYERVHRYDEVAFWQARTTLAAGEPGAQGTLGLPETEQDE